MTRIIALCNQKGGVGKTTLTAALAEELARRGLRVLVVDADPQANLTAHLGVEITEGMFTLNDVLHPESGAGQEGLIYQACARPGGGWLGQLAVVPSELQLAHREQDQNLGRELRLRKALAGPDRELFDIVLIDCPPSLGLLTVNALIAADAVLAVTDARAAAVEGLRQMVQTLAEVQATYNERLQLAGVVINRFRGDRVDQAGWADQLRQGYGAALIEPFVPEREVVARASSVAQPLGSIHVPAAGDVLGAVAAIADRIAKED